MFKAIHRLLMHRPVFRRFVIIFGIAILGLVDFLTGYELSFSVFYLGAVSLAAWYDNKTITILTIIASAMTWLWADFFSGHQYSNHIIPFWNACVRFAFFCIVAYLMRRVRFSLKDMTQMAMKDALTKLNNSRAFQIEYATLQKLSLRHKMNFAVAMIDLDGFKGVNDRLGHQAGDIVLQRFANVLQQVTRDSDIVARLGGDEFAVLLLDTDAHGVKEYDQRLRTAFLDSQLKQDYGVDFSMGIRLFEQLPSQLEDATTSADQLMYQSKQKGKSQTTILTLMP